MGDRLERATCKTAARRARTLPPLTCRSRRRGASVPPSIAVEHDGELGARAPIRCAQATSNHEHRRYSLGATRAEGASRGVIKHAGMPAARTGEHALTERAGDTRTSRWGAPTNLPRRMRESGSRRASRHIKRAESAPHDENTVCASPRRRASDRWSRTLARVFSVGVDGRTSASTMMSRAAASTMMP